MSSFEIKDDFKKQLMSFSSLPTIGEEDEKSKKESEIREKYSEIKNKSEIPPRYKGASIIDFDQNLIKQYQDSIQSILSGEFLLIHSQIPGSGKTHFATAIMNDIILRDENEAIKINKVNFYRGIKFLTAPDFMLVLKHCIKSDNTSEMSAMDIYKKCDILLLDDYGAENNTPYSSECIYSIVNHRYNHKKITIITTNLSINTLKDRDSRIYSRISCGTIIQMPDKNWRKKIN